MTPLEQVLSSLRRAKENGRGWTALCPAHDDQHASLSVGIGENGHVLLHCHAGCTVEAITAALGLKVADLMPARARASRGGQIVRTYRYDDEQGHFLFESVRLDPKEFKQRQRGPDGWVWNLQGVRRVLYRLTDLLKADPTLPVFIVEGEKDADALWNLGLPATTNPMGAGKWRQEYTDWLKEHLPGRQFVILPDNDDAGTKHEFEVRTSLEHAGLKVTGHLLPGLPHHGDVSDWIREGGDPVTLLELVKPPPHPLISKLLTREQIRNLPPPLWQVEGILQEASIVEIYGESNHGKSLVGVDLALSVVKGGVWWGRPILKPGPVIYVNADGGRGFSDRLRWWEKANGTECLWEFYTYPEELLLADARQMSLFTDGLELLPEPPVMVFFDTLSQCIPGIDENQQKEMSPVVRHLNVINRRYGTTSVLLHHAGKDGRNRGSTVIPGAADTIIRVSQLPGNLIEMGCDKQRNGPKFEPIYFHLATEGVDEGVYIVEADAPGKDALKSAREQKVAEALRLNEGWLTQKDVKARTLGISAASIYRFLKSLVKEGKVEERDGTDEAGHAAKWYRWNELPS